MGIFDPEIRAGIVKNVVNTGSGISFKLGTPPLLLSLGALPNKRFGTLFAPNKLDADEYIGVAVRRSLLQPLNYVLLAYRRPRAEVHLANFTTAAWGLVASTCAMIGTALTDTLTEGITLFAVSALVATPCVFRLLSVRKAALLLRQWQAPV